MDCCFRISDAPNFLQLEALEFADFEENWIKFKIELKTGGFYGSYNADFRAEDLEHFKQQFALLYDNLSGLAHFYDLENYLEIQIQGDGFGHFETNVKACDNSSPGKGCLTFSLNFDQTFIKDITRRLNEITKVFPVKSRLK